MAGPPTSTQLIDATRCVKMWDATFAAEKLNYISNYQTLSDDKNWESYQPSTKLIKKVGAYMCP